MATQRSIEKREGGRRGQLSSLTGSLRGQRVSTWVEGVRKDLKLNQEPWPVVGAAVAGGAALALASAIGAGELAIGGAAAYATFRVIRDGLSPKRAAREGAKVGRGEAPKERETKA